MKKRKGFTLVEILVVAAVVAILAVGVVALVATTLTNTRRNACASNLKSLSTAAQRRLAEGNAWPSSTADLLTVIQTLPDCSSPASSYFVTNSQTDLSPLIGNQYVGCTVHGYLENLGVAVAIPAGTFSW